MAEYKLGRFLDAHGASYASALQEIKDSRKRSHWMWFIFPQIAGLGMSSVSRHYAIVDLQEAKEYMKNPLLRAHILEICRILLQLEDKNADKIFGFPDNLKLKSSMTLVEAAVPEYPVFGEVLDQYFEGERDGKTLDILRDMEKK